MKNIEIGAEGQVTMQTTPDHTAASVGNPGVEVLGTAALIVFFEDAAHHCLLPYFDVGEISLGTTVNIKHLAAATAGSQIIAKAVLLSQEKNNLNFSVKVWHKDRLLMKGEHGRAVVQLNKFLSAVKAL